MAKKTQTLLESVRAARAAAPARRRGWLSKLTPEQRTEMLEIKRAWRAGEIGGSGLDVAQDIVRLGKESGLRTCGPYGVQRWLFSDD